METEHGHARLVLLVGFAWDADSRGARRAVLASDARMRLRSDLDKSGSSHGQGMLDFNEFLEIMTARRPNGSERSVRGGRGVGSLQRKTVWRAWSVLVDGLFRSTCRRRLLDGTKAPTQVVAPKRVRLRFPPPMSASETRGARWR